VRSLFLALCNPNLISHNIRLLEVFSLSFKGLYLCTSSVEKLITQGQ
jgi:hypothetical protein